MPKNTQVPEVGDHIICIHKGFSFWSHVYGEKMTIIKIAKDGCFMCRKSNGDGLFPLRQHHFYIV